jgi:hypothetical protein
VGGLPGVEHLTDGPLPRGTREPVRKRGMRAHLKTVPDAAGGGGQEPRRGGEEGWGCNNLEVGLVGVDTGEGKEPGDK